MASSKVVTGIVVSNLQHTGCFTDEPSSLASTQYSFTLDAASLAVLLLFFISTSVNRTSNWAVRFCCPFLLSPSILML